MRKAKIGNELQPSALHCNFCFQVSLRPDEIESKMDAVSKPRNTRNTRKEPSAYVSGFRVFRVFRGCPWPALVLPEPG